MLLIKDQESLIKAMRAILKEKTLEGSFFRKNETGTKITVERTLDKKIALELTKLYFENEFDAANTENDIFHEPISVFKRYWCELATMV